MLTADNGMTRGNECWNYGSRTCVGPPSSPSSSHYPPLSSFLSLLMAVLLFAASATTEVEAQLTQKEKAPQSKTIEARIDVIGAKNSAAQAGIGILMFGGTYVRTGIVGAVGATRDGLSSRADGFAIFHLDPFRQSRWASYGGAGLSGRFDEGSRPRAYLLVFAGVDGPVKNGLTTSVEAGLGGGVRLGVIIRQAVAERR